MTYEDGKGAVAPSPDTDRTLFDPSSLRITRKARFALGACCLLSAALIFQPATASAGADLVVEPVDATRLVALSQHRASWATAENDLGEVAGDLPLSHLTIVLNSSAQSEFEDFLNQQQDPNSPNFHHWLSPTEVGERFGASAHDVQAVTSWLQSQGLHVNAVSNSHLRVDVSGSAANVGAALASRLHAYLVNGEQRIAPAGVPRIPAALSTIVRSVRGLATIREKPSQGFGTAHFAGRAAGGVDSGLSSCSTNSCRHYIFPADFAAIYDVNPAYQQGIDGRGQTIAVIGRARVYLPDVENFQTKSGLAIKDPTIIVPPEGTDPGPAASSGGVSEDQLEATLDVTRATSVAPGATIDLVVSADAQTGSGLGIAAAYVVDNRLAQIMNISFGACEASAGRSGIAFWDSLFSQAAAEGISVFVVSGDSGAAGCDAYNTTPPASQTLSPNYICASSYVTCVGGTEFTDTANPSAYWSSTTGVGLASALSYIPEGAWNEPMDGSGSPQASASGGGVSAYVSTPSWQTGFGLPAQGRYTPDVSFSASAHNGYFACLAAAGNSCISDASGHFQFEYFFGASAATADMAGFAALLNQKMGSPQGNLNPRLYALAATPASAVFHDVTVSTSGVPGCDVSIPSTCNNSIPGPAGSDTGLAGYIVRPGYDEVTGLGSIDVANLLAQWFASPGSAQSLQTRIDLNRRGLTGSWFQPATSGQGVELEIYPDLIAPGTGLLQGAWFTYDYTSPGGPASQRWYTFSGNVQAGQPSATLTLYENTGGNFNAPPVTEPMPVGTVVFSATDCSHTTMSYSFTDGSGRSGIIPMTRLLPNVTCAVNGSETSSTDFSYSGNWYDRTTSGQGIVFELNPNQPMAWLAWYTYAPDGQALGEAGQRWYTAQAAYTPGTRSVSMILYETTGGLFDKSMPRPTTVSVGTARATFTSCTAMQLSFNFTGGSSAGTSGTIDMTRVGPAPADCHP
ncbi:MAG TPA: S53 family peptidase [Casimicrobiaceae bacterium]|nr:S53 family peptidase [Casimicrobiaceae bacterium]